MWDSAEVGGLGVDVDPGHQALAEEGGLLMCHGKARLFIVDTHKYARHQELPLHNAVANCKSTIGYDGVYMPSLEHTFCPNLNLKPKRYNRGLQRLEALL